jgi:hypothetical protein
VEIFMGFYAQGLSLFATNFSPFQINELQVYVSVISTFLEYG